MRFLLSLSLSLLQEEEKDRIAREQRKVQQEWEDKENSVMAACQKIYSTQLHRAQLAFQKLSQNPSREGVLRYVPSLSLLDLLSPFLSYSLQEVKRPIRGQEKPPNDGKMKEKKTDRKSNPPPPAFSPSFLLCPSFALQLRP